MNQLYESVFLVTHNVRLILAPILLITLTTLATGQQLRGRSASVSPFDVSFKAPASGERQASPRQGGRLTRDEAVRLALSQASAFQIARYAELIASEDVRQSRTAFLPRITVPLTTTYNSPTLGRVVPGTPRAERFSFIAANAVAEYEALGGGGGEIDIAGRLRASLRRSVALLEAARAGTEIARRALIQAVDEAYYGLAFSSARRRSSEMSVAAAEDFARITELMLNAGEVAQVDVIRARLQLASRRDELEQARAGEAVAAGSLRILIGYDSAAPVEIADLTTDLPSSAEIDRFVAATVSNRPEFAQFDAERRAAEQEAKAARAERRPQLTYSVGGGFDSQSLKPDPLHDHAGVIATMSLNIPIFDWGASRSREEQARLRIQSLEAEKALAWRDLNRQFEAARAQALAAVSRYQLLSRGVADAEQNVQASLARYRSGEAPLIEVTDALSTVAAQRAALNQALLDYQVARSRLIQVTAQ